MKIRSDRPQSSETIAQVISRFGLSTIVPSWPPDGFALALHLLEASGAYTRAVDDWPPSDAEDSRSRQAQARDWATKIREIGRSWRRAYNEGAAPPSEVQEWWLEVLSSSEISLTELRDANTSWAALLQICAAADEACDGIGLPTRPGETRDALTLDGFAALQDRGSLCNEIDPAIARVLPKLHTPQVGMTTRSLSHNLALVVAPDVQPRWHLVSAEDRRTLNILVVPWPKTIMPSQFRATDGPIGNMPDTFGFFTFAAAGNDRIATDLGKLFDKAKTLVGHIDGVVLPEMSLTETDHESAKNEIVTKRRAFLVAGTGRSAAESSFGDNSVRFDFPFPGDKVVAIEPQHKHHRWKLDPSQVNQYGLASSLAPQKTWWECIPIADRALTFVALEPALTVCVLICEDLARQDPVADLVRSVGPNLVIALLMDGPQLAARWSARYATVLADDPGCSVLTLTAAGMVDLCRGPRRFLESRFVALWKDPHSGGPFEINLPADADGLILALELRRTTEWTADGRSDDGATGQPTLAGVYPVSL